MVGVGGGGIRSKGGIPATDVLQSKVRVIV